MDLAVDEQEVEVAQDSMEEDDDEEEVAGAEEQEQDEQQQQQQQREEEEQRDRNGKKRKSAILAAKKKRKRERRAQMAQLSTIASEVGQIRQQMQEQNKLISEQNSLIREQLVAFQESACRSAAAAAALAGVWPSPSSATPRPPRGFQPAPPRPAGVSGLVSGLRGVGNTGQSANTPVRTTVGSTPAQNVGASAAQTGGRINAATNSGVPPSGPAAGASAISQAQQQQQQQHQAQNGQQQLPQQGSHTQLLSALQQAAATPLEQANITSTPSEAARRQADARPWWFTSCVTSTDAAHSPEVEEHTPDSPQGRPQQEAQQEERPQQGEQQQQRQGQADPGYRVVKNALGRNMLMCGICERTYSHSSGLQRHRNREHGLDEVHIEPRKRGPPATSTSVRRTRVKKVVLTPREKHASMRKSVKHDFKKRLQLRYSRIPVEEQANSDRDKWVEDQLTALWPAWCTAHPQPPPGSVDNEAVRAWLEHDKIRDAFEDDTRTQGEAMWKEKPNYSAYPLEEKWWFLRQYLLPRMAEWLANNPYPDNTTAAVTAEDESEDDADAWGDVREVALQVSQNFQDELP